MLRKGTISISIWHVHHAMHDTIQNLIMDAMIDITPYGYLHGVPNIEFVMDTAIWEEFEK